MKKILQQLLKEADVHIRFGNVRLGMEKILFARQFSKSYGSQSVDEDIKKFLIQTFM